MEKVRITKIFRFEMAHALMGYDGLCSNIHGHSYELRVTVTGEPATAPDSPKCGMLMDFSDLKRIVNACIVERFDHALVLNNQSDRELIEQLGRHYRKVELVPYQPTSERMLLHFAEMLRRQLPSQVRLHSLRLGETATSYAEWYAEDNR
ncbi:MAG: 6-carboxytetrahydropterin synthase [Bacteroidales bacterium]|nr:6-carboxytetrahydropterin synthase [Bacteroidales bacterium]